MATLNHSELQTLAWFASKLADALASSDQVIRVSFDDAPALVVIDRPRPRPRPEGGICWQMPDPKDTVVYSDRAAAQAELAIMLRIILDAVTNLPVFDAVTIDPVLAPGG